jgi:hypothetical protein
LSHAEFIRAVHRERARAHRTACDFLVLSVTLRPPARDRNACDPTLHLLARIIGERARMSDIAGWCSAAHDQIGLLLPQTSWEGAECLIRDVEQRLHERLARDMAAGDPRPELSCEVVRYPSDGEAEISLISTPASPRRAP